MAVAAADDAIHRDHDDGAIGITYGDVGTSTLHCTVVRPVERNDYVVVHHEAHGPVLGQVVDVERKTDLSLDRALEATDDHPPEVHDREYAVVAILGYRDRRGLLQVPRTPFRAGEAVHRAPEDLIRSVLALHDDRDHGAYVGILAGHDLRVYIDINAMVQKHVSILAKTGGGKSYISGVLVEELMKHGVTTLVLDPHGEYRTLGEPTPVTPDQARFGVAPRAYGDHLQEFSPDPRINPGAKPLRFSLRNISARDLLELAGQGNNRVALGVLKKALAALGAVGQPFDLGDVMRMVQAEGEGHDVLLGALEYLRDAEIFATQGTRMEDLVAPGKTTVINLKGTPPDLQGLIADRLATALFELRKLDKVPPMMLVVEEAHTFCPQVGQAASSRVLRTIASEGRKFGLGLLVITQRAAKVDKNVLSQCNLQFILKVTNPNDLKAITSSVEGITRGMEDEIQRLPVGVTLVMGANLPVPLFVEVRPRETRHGGESVKVLPD